MRGRPPAGFILLCAILFLFPGACFRLAAQNNNPPHHRGEVTALIMDDRGRILSAGEDGFLLVWDIQKNAVTERFQIGFYPIRSMALRPGKPELAFLETNNAGLSKVSVWDYEKKENLFTLPFRSGDDNVFYSDAGSFLIVTGSRLEYFDSETGVSLGSQYPSGTVTFAATGRSERSMVIYSNSGLLTYMDLETGNETQSLNVPVNISSPLLLGNNRFLAGFDSNGFLVLDAVTGSIIIRESGIRNGILFTANPQGLEFVCLIPEGTGNSGLVYHYGIESPGRLRTINRRNIPGNIPAVNTGAVIATNEAALGTVDGRVIILNSNGTARVMESGSQIRIEAAAASSHSLAFHTEDSFLGFVPLDFTHLYSRPDLELENRGPYNSISGGESDFIFWQVGNTDSFPQLKNTLNNTEIYFDQLSLRFPLRSVSVHKNLCLFLNSAGNITIIDKESWETVYTYQAAGAQDAVFIDERNILIGRSATNRNSAFLIVNINTGETVPLPLQTDLGIKVYRGASGLFGAGINRMGSGFRTSVFSINAASPARSRLLAEFDTDDIGLSMAESGGFFLAWAAGSGNAGLFWIGEGANPQGVSASAGTVLERSAGLPVILLNGGACFVSVDSDGNICWHDPFSGRIMAVFRLYENTWILERNGEIISGRVLRN